jgi:hypothetical protein
LKDIFLVVDEKYLSFHWRHSSFLGELTCFYNEHSDAISGPRAKAMVSVRRARMPCVIRLGSCVRSC